MNKTQLQIQKYAEIKRKFDNLATQYQTLTRFVEDFEKIESLTPKANYTINMEGGGTRLGTVYLQDINLDKNDLLKNAKIKLASIEAEFSKLNALLTHLGE